MNRMNREELMNWVTSGKLGVLNDFEQTLMEGWLKAMDAESIPVGRDVRRLTDDEFVGLCYSELDR